MESLPITVDGILQGGAVGLLGLVAVMIFMGWLVPGRTYNALKQERDYWRDAALKSLGQTEKLLPAAQITTEFTRALAGYTALPGHAGVHDPAPPALDQHPFDPAAPTDAREAS